MDIAKARFVDPFGYAWSIATVKEEMSVEEMDRRLKGLRVRPEGGKLSAKDELQKGVNPVPRGFHRVTPYIVTPEWRCDAGFREECVWS